MRQTFTPFKKYAGPSLWDLSRVEYNLSVRNGGFRALAALMMVACVMNVVAARYGQTFLLRVTPSVAEGLRGMCNTLLLLLSPLVVCGAALREQRQGMSELVLSKPPSSEFLGWSKFLGSLMALGMAVLLSVMAAWIAQMVLCWPETSLWPLLVAGWRGFVPLIFFAGISFSLALFFRTPMVSGLAVAVDLGLQIAIQYVVPAMRFTLTPYQIPYALLGFAVVGLTVGGWERRRDPEIRVQASWSVSLACLLGFMVLGGTSMAKWRGWTLSPDPAVDALANIGKGKHPQLPDHQVRTADGGTISLSQWRGKPLVVAFWSTGAPGAASEVAAMERGWRESGTDEVGFVNVCETEDPGLAKDLAKAAGIRTPVILNPPVDMDDNFGMETAFGVQRPFWAVAGVVYRDGTISRPSAVSQFPQQPPSGHPPRRAWEDQLTEQAKLALPKLAERREKRA